MHHLISAGQHVFLPIDGTFENPLFDHLEDTVVHPVRFCVGFVEQCQYRFPIPKIRRIFCDIGSQFFEIAFQVNHLQSVVMLTLMDPNYKWLDSPKVYETFIGFDSFPEKEPVVFC